MTQCLGNGFYLDGLFVCYADYIIIDRFDGVYRVGVNGSGGLSCITASIMETEGFSSVWEEARHCKRERR
jgi:hypothetical protein